MMTIAHNQENFIGAGSSRVVFKIRPGRVRKCAIHSRKAAGSQQNALEWKLWNAWHLRGKMWTFMPRVFRHSADFSKLVVEEVPLVGSCIENDVVASQIEEQLEDAFAQASISLPIQTPYGNAQTRLQAVMLGIGPLVQSLLNTASSSDFTQLHMRISNLMHNAALDPLKRQLCQLAYVLLHSENPTPFMLAFRELLECCTYAEKCDRPMIADLWHPSQWGMTDGQFKVLDCGYSHEISIAHYTTPPPQLLQQFDDTTTFAGIPLSNINSPAGARLQWKFNTKSEYVMAADGMTRRIKCAGLNDDGLHSWANTAVFMPYDSLARVINAVKNEFRRKQATKVLVNKRTRKLKIFGIDEFGRWKRTACVKHINLTPQIGQHVCEFFTDGKHVIKSFHPGHAVCAITRLA